MKKITLALVFLTLLISSCTDYSPKSILSDYLKATASGNYEAAYALISSEDQAVKEPSDLPIGIDR